MAFVNDWKIIYCNEAYSELVGKPVSELTGKNLLELFPDFIGTSLHLACIDVLQTGEPRLIEGDFIGKKVIERLYKIPGGAIALYQDVTERRRSRPVVVSDADWHVIFNEVNDGIFIFDAFTGRIRDVNHRACRMFGYSREQFLRLNIGDIYLGEGSYSRDDVLRWFKKVAAEEQAQYLEWMARDSSGRQFWIEIKAKPIVVEDQKHLLGVMRDITDNKLNQKKLKESIDRYFEIFENANDMIYVHDLDGNYLRVNKASERITGYWREELLKMNVTELIGEESMNLHHSYLMLARKMAKQKKAKHQPIYYEMEITSKQGRTVFLEISSWLVYSDREAVAVQGIARDITERKLDELEMLENQEMLTDIIDSLPDPTLAINTEGRVIIWNSAMEEFTGIKAEEMLGKGNYEYALPLYGERRPILVDLILHPDEISRDYTVVEKENYVLIGETDVPKLSSAGKYLWGKAAPLYDRSGRMIGAIELVRDMSEHMNKLFEVQRKLENVLNS
jgi:PAS domain S-box-containing protein